MDVASHTKLLVVCACLFAVTGILLVLWAESTTGRVLGGIQVLVGLGLAVVHYRGGVRQRSRDAADT
jgi:NO-binding membrane sensor protein with MHYT domain